MPAGGDPGDQDLILPADFLRRAARAAREGHLPPGTVAALLRTDADRAASIVARISPSVVPARAHAPAAEPVRVPLALPVQDVSPDPGGIRTGTAPPPASVALPKDADLEAARGGNRRPLLVGALLGLLLIALLVLGALSAPGAPLAGMVGRGGDAGSRPATGTGSPLLPALPTGGGTLPGRGTPSPLQTVVPAAQAPVSSPAAAPPLVQSPSTTPIAGATPGEAATAVPPTASAPAPPPSAASEGRPADSSAGQTYARVIEPSGANLRGAPGLDGPLTRRLHFWTPVVVIGARTGAEPVPGAGERWLEVRLLDTGQTGFLHASLLRDEPAAVLTEQERAVPATGMFVQKG